ncbi:hypothetical protein [Pseudomonas aeruginosa]|uniref:hypothetical protein n=1 Tax=Pseudomonas aeruginosa TaxID=287 RepID=UPI0020968F38|nr:hypothetical protein [Pseudomonas aeruginosa]MCO7708891.1 hypothetical protein [Pseudomonas aeruginosa]MCO7714757.1 hypothetical protein [Pseudomonas aeruginosa]MCO7720606.1 hypothetical protein [Pseudomonas aeruginosa]MCO7734024.1 hypothetical protein [Pseudomonas aeruginosa]MCO7754146.1 hypothetical protein [Pseudomonas aeruginosa]
MPVFEVVSGGDRRSLMKRFERKSKQQAISELVDFHLLNCARIEKLEEERDAALARVAGLELGIARIAGDFLPDNSGQAELALDEMRQALHELLAAAPTQAQHSVPKAWLDVQAERRRQVENEGWTPEHDDEHSYGQMGRAAACYALAGSSAPNDGTAALLVSLAWPWDEQWWKPSTARRDLVKACALALAEIERLDRATATQGGPRDA